VLWGGDPRAGRELSHALPSMPPANRSRVALRLTAAAAVGRFELQQCQRCAAVQYPPREACHRCLSVDLQWVLQPGTGQLISETTLFHSHEPYFRQRLPWRIGLVKLDAGPIVVAHLHRSVPAAPAAVLVTVRLDKAGHAALTASAGETTGMSDDPHIAAMGCDPRGLNVFIADGTAPVGQPLIRAMLRAGAQRVWAGQPPGKTATDWPASVAAVTLDFTSVQSVERVAAEIGPEIDILVNNSFCESGTATVSEERAREEMETHYFGLLRLSQHFAPLMETRAVSASANCAWVNLLTLDAMCSLPSQPTYSASMAAALSLSQSLRSRLRRVGVRVVNVFAGPITADRLSTSIVSALIDGVEDVYPGDVAQDWLARWLDSPKVLEREIAG
jgi:NAD(P)-dependent dehydrogenase (short-subunit alcohol dehydrogenase family)